MDEKMKRKLTQWMNIWKLKLHHGLNTKEKKYKLDKKFNQFSYGWKVEVYTMNKKLKMKNEKMEKK